jgi:hypothetical protein
MEKWNSWKVLLVSDTELRWMNRERDLLESLISILACNFNENLLELSSICLKFANEYSMEDVLILRLERSKLTQG